MPRPPILIIDDEPPLLRLVRRSLEQEGYPILTATTGQEALAVAEEQSPALIILDLILPDLDGFEVCRKLREFTDAPIMMLTARREDQDKVRGLDMGADDYLTKPFSPEELRARVRALLRRSRLSVPPPPARYENGHLEVDFDRRCVEAGGRQVHLTPTEYKLLHLLVSNAGKVLLHREILAQVWGPGYEDAVHYLRMYIWRLRLKLEPDPRRPCYLLSAPGIGYTFRSRRQA